MRALFLLLLVTGACSKAGKYPEETGPQKEAPVIPQKVKTFTGDLLTITNANQAAIALKGEAAKKLFESLQLEPFKLLAGGEFGEGLRKNGQFIICEQSTLAAQPENKLYKCAFSLSPKNGLFEGNPNDWSREEKSEAPVAEHKEKNLEISGETFTVNLRGKDARALYESLDLFVLENFDAEKNIRTLTKDGSPGIKCTETITEEEKHQYRCSMSFSLFTGAP